jgi:tetratricopeptide (TPR) repeat protein
VPPLGYPGEPVVGLALLADVLGNYADAVALAHQALAAAEASGDIFSESVAYYVLASTAYAQGEYGAARREAGRAYELAVEIDSRWMMAYTAIIQGNVAGACGEYGAAHRYYAHSHTIQRELGNPEGMAIAQLSLARLEAGQRSYHEAERLFQDSYALYREINDPGGQIRALLGLGDIAQVQGSGAQASSYFCTGLALAIAIHSLPLLLLLFTPIGELLASAGELALATSAWLLVTQHAAGERAMQQRARKDLQRGGAKGAALALARQVDGAAGSDPFALAALLRDKLAAITEASEYHAAGNPCPNASSRSCV